MKSIVLVTNHLTPYRRKFYDDFYNVCKDRGIKFTVLLMTRREPKRDWDYESLKVDYALLMKDIHFTFPINNHLNLEVNSQLQRLKPDLVLMAGSYMYLTNWLVLSKKAKRKYSIVYWNEAHFNEKREHRTLILKLRNLIRQTIFPLFDGFWCSGIMSEKLVCHYGKSDAKRYFLPNFVDNKSYSATRNITVLERQDIRKKMDIPVDARVAIIPARLSKEKGIDKFLGLLKECEIPSNVVILLAGSGDYRDVIFDAIKDIEIDVRLLGFQKQPEMLDLYSISDLFVLPSLSDCNPLTCIEALWCGLPLLVTLHVGNYPEVVHEDVNGYVFDYDDKETSISKIQRFFNNNDTWYENAKKTSVSIAKNIYDPQLRMPEVLDKMIKELA